MNSIILEFAIIVWHIVEVFNNYIDIYIYYAYRHVFGICQTTIFSEYAQVYNFVSL